MQGSPQHTSSYSFELKSFKVNPDLLSDKLMKRTQYGSQIKAM